MKMNFGERLDVILEEETTRVSDNFYQDATDIAVELEEARRKVTELERQLIYAVDRLCGGLAIGARKHQPGLNVGIHGGCCKVGYKTKTLAFKPDLINKVWTLDSPDQSFMRRFNRLHGPRTNLVNDLEPLAKAVATFFSDHYKSLGESVHGIGSILIEGKKAGLGDLAQFILTRSDYAQ